MDIKSVIKKYGYTVNSLAKKHNVGQSRLNQMVNGNPSGKNLEWLASLIGCHPAEFFADWQQPAPQPAGESASAEQEKTQDGEGGASDLPFSSEPSATSQQAIVCPHCHHALVFSVASYDQK